ncbi:iron-sulfur cluster assembly protein [Escherichia coli]|uniref:Iron-sulfur cluster assembly protein n=1 Tax=Escherichia coli TaxID=562 RepID=A0A376W8A8_ECOLX|nr:iron-sulfur cluster assembly protein [Escherichia coli]
MSITLSDSAAARVNTFWLTAVKGLGLRLGVRTSGCSGMAYVLELLTNRRRKTSCLKTKA